MSRKQHKPEEIVAKLQKVEMLTAQGRTVEEAIRFIDATEVTSHRWRTGVRRLKGDQVERFTELEAENVRLGELFGSHSREVHLREADSGNF